LAASSACTSIDFNYWRISCLVDNGSTNTRFNRDGKAYLCLVPILMTTLLLFGYFFYRPWEDAAHLTEARTQLLTAMILIELANAIFVRSLGHHIWQVGVFKNKIWCAVGASFLLQLLMLNTTGLSAAFDVSAPRPLDWAFAMFFHSDGFHHSEDCEVDYPPQMEGSWKDLYLRPGKNALKVTEKRAEDLKHDVHES